MTWSSPLRSPLAQPEIHSRRFSPASHPTFLRSVVGPPKVALELVLLGEPVTAKRALSSGIVNRLVPEAKLEAHRQGTLCARIAGHLWPGAHHGQESHLGRHGPLAFADGLRNSMNILPSNELYRLEDPGGSHAP